MVKAKNKPRVLICCPDLSQLGGVSNYYRTIRKYLPQNDTISFFESGGKYLKINDSTSVSGAGEKVKSYPLFIAIFIEPIRFLKQLIKKKFDIVLLNPSLLPRAIIKNSVFLMIAKCFKKKTIVFWRGFNLAVEERIEKRAARLFASVFNQADLTLVLAKAFREQLRTIGIIHPILVTNTLVDMGLIPKQELPKTNSSGKKLLFLSRLEREKGIFETIEAFKILREEFEELSLDIVGDSPKFNKLRKEYRGIGAITFHGYVGGLDKYRFMINSDIFIFPSYTEGMPNVVLEAMACGLPVIATPVGGLNDFFIDGVHGFLLGEKDPVLLSQLIKKLLLDHSLRQKISKHNAEYAKKNFSAIGSVNFLQDVFDAVSNNQIDKLPVNWFDNDHK